MTDCTPESGDATCQVTVIDWATAPLLSHTTVTVWSPGGVPKYRVREPVPSTTPSRKSASFASVVAMHVSPGRGARNEYVGTAGAAIDVGVVAWAGPGPGGGCWGWSRTGAGGCDRDPLAVASAAVARQSHLVVAGLSWNKDSQKPRIIHHVTKGVAVVGDQAVLPGRTVGYIHFDLVGAP